MNFDINHPVTVIAILSVTLGFIAMVVKEMRFWLQAARKETPTHEAVEQLKIISRQLDELYQLTRNFRFEWRDEHQITKEKSDEILERVKNASRDERTV